MSSKTLDYQKITTENNQVAHEKIYSLVTASVNKGNWCPSCF